MAEDLEEKTTEELEEDVEEISEEELEYEDEDSESSGELSWKQKLILINSGIVAFLFFYYITISL